MVWIKPLIVERRVDKKEREHNLWKVECLHERFLLESLSIKPLSDLESRAGNGGKHEETSKTKTISAYEKQEHKTERRDVQEKQEEQKCHGRQKLWRIAMKRRDTTVVVAEDDNEESIRREWSWIESNVMTKLEEIKAGKGGSKEVDQFLELQFQVGFALLCFLAVGLLDSPSTLSSRCCILTKAMSLSSKRWSNSAQKKK